jgi:hypothetical protein
MAKKPGPPAKTAREKTAKKAEPKKAEPKKAEPKRAEPKKAEPKKAEPRKAEPKKAEPKGGEETRRTWRDLDDQEDEIWAEPPDPSLSAPSRKNAEPSDDDDDDLDSERPSRRGPRSEAGGRSKKRSAGDDSLEVEEFEIIDEDFDSPELDLDLPIDRSPERDEFNDDDELPVHAVKPVRRPAFKKPPTKKTPAKKPAQTSASDKEA